MYYSGGDVDDVGGKHMGSEGLWKCSVPSAQFCCSENC